MCATTQGTSRQPAGALRKRGTANFIHPCSGRDCLKIRERLQTGTCEAAKGAKKKALVRPILRPQEPTIECTSTLFQTVSLGTWVNKGKKRKGPKPQGGYERGADGRVHAGVPTEGWLREQLTRKDFLKV